MKTKTTVSLTYDGGTISQIETVIPQLESRGIKATFYVDPVGLMENVDIWRIAAMYGHEIGNGCLLNECLPDGSFPAWTTEMILDEVLSAGELIDDLIVQDQWSVALPAGSRACADSQDYIKALTPHVLLRTQDQGHNDIHQIESNALNSLSFSGLSHHQMVRATELAIEAETWLIPVISDVGSGHKSIDSCAHEKFLDWLFSNAERINVCPVSQALRTPSEHPFRVL